MEGALWDRNHLECPKISNSHRGRPRRHHYGEHVDDHQMELAQQLVGHELIEVVYELENLEPAEKNAGKRQKSG
jgi:UDP-N-acetylglucosamine transferase subunit ALG13